MECVEKQTGIAMAQSFLYPQYTPAPKTPKDYDIPYLEVKFPSREDKVELAGWLLNPEGKKVIIMNHFGIFAHKYGYQPEGVPKEVRPYDKEVNFILVAKNLVNAGYAVLMYDLRNHGESAKFNEGSSTSGVKESHDVLGAIDYIISNEKTKDKPIGMLSHCMGSVSSFYAQGKDPEFFSKHVKSSIQIQPLKIGIVAQTFLKISGDTLKYFNEEYLSKTGSSPHEDFYDKVSSVNVPTKLIQVRKDVFTDMKFIEKIYESIKGEKEMKYLEDAEHRFEGYTWLADHPEDMLPFFEKYVK